MPHDQSRVGYGVAHARTRGQSDGVQAERSAPLRRDRADGPQAPLLLLVFCVHWVRQDQLRLWNRSDESPRRRLPTRRQTSRPSTSAAISCCVRKRKRETPELTLSAHPRLAQSLIDGDFRLSEGYRRRFMWSSRPAGSEKNFGEGVSRPASLSHTWHGTFITARAT